MNDISPKYPPLARDKKIKIDSYLSKELAPVYADIALIERVIQNLQCTKFTPENGHITLTTENK
jgi:K+-sensing histidine kinase KdpD